MNSILRYSVRKIVSNVICFVLSLELKEGYRHWFFSNAPWMGERRKVIGVEFGEDDLKETLRGVLPSAKADFSFSGTYSPEFASSVKLSFRLDGCSLLSGNYVLLCPSWGRHCERKMWLLIPSSGGEGEVLST